MCVLTLEVAWPISISKDSSWPGIVVILELAYRGAQHRYYGLVVV